MNKKLSWCRKLVALTLVGVIIVFCAFFSTNGFKGMFSPDETFLLEVSSGMTGAQIAATLESNGIVANELFFRLALKLSGKGAEIKAGTYELSAQMSYGEIINTLTSFSTAGLIKMTVPEGYKLSQVAEVVESSGFGTAESFLKEAAEGEFDYAFLEDIPQNDPNRLEGFLFPDTYLINKDASPREIIIMMLDGFEKVYSEDIAKAAESFDMTTREFITLASIIEKEGVGDLGKISSVFHNRLEIGMRLESCATVNYLFDTPKDVLSIADTYIDSPYNTYRNNGLPPSPICSPGANAIEAAAYPENTNYLYFIADGKGGNLFSENYEQHLEKKGNI